MKYKIGLKEKLSPQMKGIVGVVQYVKPHGFVNIKNITKVGVGF